MLVATIVGARAGTDSVLQGLHFIARVRSAPRTQIAGDAGQVSRRGRDVAVISADRGRGLPTFGLACVEAVEVRGAQLSELDPAEARTEDGLYTRLQVPKRDRTTPESLLLLHPAIEECPEGLRAGVSACRHLREELAEPLLGVTFAASDHPADPDVDAVTLRPH